MWPSYDNISTAAQVLSSKIAGIRTGASCVFVTVAVLVDCVIVSPANEPSPDVCFVFL